MLDKNTSIEPNIYSFRSERRPFIGTYGPFLEQVKSFSSDANDFRSRLLDCSFLERVLQCTIVAFNCFLNEYYSSPSHVSSMRLFSRFQLFGFLYFMFLIPSFLYVSIHIYIIHIIHVRILIEFSSSLTQCVKIND